LFGAGLIAPVVADDGAAVVVDAGAATFRLIVPFAGVIPAWLLGWCEHRYELVLHFPEEPI